MIRNSGSSISERARKLLNGGQPEQPRRAPQAGPRRGTTTVASVRRELLDRILQNRGAIPDLLLALGVRDVGAAITLYEGFTTLVIELAEELADDAYRGWVADDDIPVVNVDWAVAAKKYGLEYGPETEERADKLVDDLYKLLDEPGQAVTAKIPEREKKQSRNPARNPRAPR